MDCNLQGLRQSPHWRKNFNGYITLEGRELSDREVRTIVTEGIKAGYKTVMQIPDEVAKQWLNLI